MGSFKLNRYIWSQYNYSITCSLGDLTKISNLTWHLMRTSSSLVIFMVFEFNTV